METKIVSFSLICIILLSSISYSYGSIDSQFVYIKNNHEEDVQSSVTNNDFVINLEDGVSAKILKDGKNKYDPKQHIVNLYDSSKGKILDGLPSNYLENQAIYKQKPKIISVYLKESATSVTPSNDDEKIVIINQSI